MKKLWIFLGIGLVGAYAYVKSKAPAQATPDATLPPYQPPYQPVSTTPAQPSATLLAQQAANTAAKNAEVAQYQAQQANVNPITQGLPGYTGTGQ